MIKDFVSYAVCVVLVALIILSALVWMDYLTAKAKARDKEPMADYLHGWTVVKNGKVVCRTPWVWGYKQEINCDL